MPRSTSVFSSPRENSFPQAGSAAALNDFFARDDYYTDHDSNVHSTTTFLATTTRGALRTSCSRTTPAQPALSSPICVSRLRPAHPRSRQPVVYYGDEQGMIGRGGNDMQAREDMFAAQARDFKTAALLGTTRTGADDKFDAHHPFYELLPARHLRRPFGFADRQSSRGRPTNPPSLCFFAHRSQGTLRISSSSSTTFTVFPLWNSLVPTRQPGGAQLKQIFSSSPQEKITGDSLVTNARGEVSVTLAPLQFAVWKAETAWAQCNRHRPLPSSRRQREPP